MNINEHQRIRWHDWENKIETNNKTEKCNNKRKHQTHNIIML